MIEALEKLAWKLAPLHYVVQRNWENFPDIKGDLDLFVSTEDYEELDKIIDEFPYPELVDIRYPGDGYYPPSIEKLLLKDYRWHHDFKIPTPNAHFFSLYYHNAVHKENNPYEKKLKELFLGLYPPVKPQDPGVGYFV